MKEQTCCITGHRVIPGEDYLEVMRKFSKAVGIVCGKGVDTFCVGGALGFDTATAMFLLFSRLFVPKLKIISVLPCKTQTKGWREHDIRIYNFIKEQSDEVIYVSEEYTRGCMFKRNRAMVDMSQYCIAYLNKDSGGTAYTVKYAKQKGLEVININDIE